MSFFSKIFGSKEEQVQRAVLVHPSQLQVGDIVKFSFMDQSELSNQRVEVIEVNTYDFEDEHSTSFTLKSVSGDVFWLSATNDDGEEYLTVSRKLTRGQVKELFNPEQFSEVFEEGLAVSLDRQAIPEGFEHWTADHYNKVEDCSKGYYRKGDFRDGSMPKYADESNCSLDYYLLEDDSESFAIEIEVYANGETEVSTSVYLELSNIDEMWPAASDDANI